MKLSIIIVEYNSDDFIKECIDSIEKQKVNFEYEIVRHDNNINNIGFGKGNNEAAKKATGEYLFLLNPDTNLLYDNSLQLLVDYLDSHANVGIVGPRLIDSEDVFQLSAGKRHTWWRMVLEKPLSFMYKKAGSKREVLKLLGLFSSRYDFESIRTDCDVVSAAALLIRREIFEQLDGFDKDFFMYFEDDDLCLRTKSLGFDVHYYSKVTIRHLVGQTEHNSDAKDTYYYQNQNLYYQKHGSVLEQLLVKIFRWPYKALKLRRVLNRYF